SQTITVQDTTAPAFVEALPADATVECDAVPTADTLTATDNCGDATVTFDETITEGACAGESVIVRTWTATDECGNETSHSQTITVQDNTAPAFVEALPADATVECDAVPTADTLTATDNCGDATVTFNETITEGACAGESTIVRTWTATDECGNETSHSQTITVQDTTAPTFVEALPADATVECDAVPTADTLTATDNCGDATVTFEEVTNEGECAGEFTVVRTWTATDECGNETSHSQTITVQDTTAPTFVEALPADATVECDAVPTAETLTATDNCGDATVTFEEVTNEGECAGEFTVVRTWTATDECGNETSHSQTITVQDTTAPAFVEALPADATVECDAVPTADTLTATDNCGDATVTFEEVTNEGECSGEFTVVRTWTATDECGNETSHSQTITVQDTTAPAFVEALPADATVECDAVPTAETLTATDNCGDATVTFEEVTNEGECAGEFTVVRIWTATDECGNETSHSQTITVQDTTAPAFVEALPADATVECDAVPTAETLTATDNCGDATVTFEEVTNEGECAGESVIVRTWTATDECGNETSHSQTITVQDTTAPTFVEALPADATVECDAVPTAETLTATDNCGDATVTFEEVTNEGECAGEFTVVRTWTATDECGNETSHSQTITVQDTTAPAFVEALPADATVECDAVPTADTLTATDNCGDATVTFEEVTNEGECSGEFTVVRTWTATDECGNETSHSQTITVQDNTAPAFVEALPADATVECDAVPTADTLTATDNCGDATVTFNETITEGACAGESTIVRTWTATDECGNETSHSQTINLVDNTAPTLTNSYEENIFVICDDIPNAPELTFEDACSTNISVIYVENSTQNDIPQNYQIIREWTVSDDCGNESIFTQTVNVSVKVEFQTIEAALCSEDLSVDLFDYLPSSTDQTGTWTVVGGNATIDGSTFDPSSVDLGDYVFRYNSNDDACFTQVLLNMNVNDDCIVLPCGLDDVVISKAVTPNNDLINDTFTVTGIEGCGFVIEVEIFNRWGAKIYENKNYQNDWGGEASKNSVGNSGIVPTGTYYYIVKLRNSGLSPITGPIYVATK
ncbi:gliding motility-associated C-terminal domain-containing protein, partial [Paucihalobacter ruber]